MKLKNLKHKKLWIILSAIILIMIVLVSSFFIWASDYYHAQDEALAIIQSDDTIKVKNNLTILSPDVETDTGFIFYPGAKVEAVAYIPILEKIKQECGVTCILVEMPLNMAIFDQDAAAEVMDQFPEITNWYIGGHSMGGAMASKFASEHENEIKGLILMGAYIYGDYPPNKALTVYGTFNSDLEDKIDYTENIVVIEGGNHAQFGNYGKQKGDPDATITASEQQNITVQAMKKFIN